MEKSQESPKQKGPLAAVPSDKSKYTKHVDQRTKQEIESKQREVERLKEVAKVPKIANTPASLKSQNEGKIAV